MKTALRIVGILMVLMGGLWTLQGLGIVTWPPQSFMIAAREWVLYGALTTAVGAGLIAIAGRR